MRRNLAENLTRTEADRDPFAPLPPDSRLEVWTWLTAAFAVATVVYAACWL